MSKIEIEKDILKSLIINSTELAWAAGILDGEGSIIVLKDNHLPKGRKTPQYKLRVQVGMCDKATIKRIHKLFGGKFNDQKCYKKPGWKQVYYWVVHSRDAEKVLKILRPFVFTKKKQLELALKFSERTLSKVGNGNVVSKKLVKQRELFWLKMKKFNQRGDYNV